MDVTYVKRAMRLWITFSSLCKDETVVGASFLSFWDFIGDSGISLGHSFELEQVLSWQKVKNRLGKQGQCF